VSEPAGERKQVTVLFADVKGSMDLAEALDAEDWAALVKQLFQLLSDGVTRFGGTVDKFTGDGIMAIFGAPVSQEDHARRACHAALQMSAAAGAFAAGLRQAKGLDLNVRIGLNSGEVVVGGIGDQGRMTYTALGHTVGLAQRMEAIADPGQVFVTQHTAGLVRSHFDLSEVGPVAVKGVSHPIGVYALRSASPAAGPGTAATLVGRADELGALEAALARAREGYAQVVGVVGEAGVGKSRLCEELVRSAAARGITVRRAAGVSHARDVPLLPVLELLRDYFGIVDADSRGEAQRKIADALLDLDPGLDDALPLLFDFLEVPDPDRTPPRLSPEARMRRIFGVLRRITQRRSERKTLILLLEDLHWFDRQSQDFVEQLIPSFPGTRTLVLTNFRPEFSPPWAAHSYYRQLPLEPLDAGAVERLLAGLVGTDPSLADLLPTVVDRTGGNPFFVEEVVRSLVENGTLTGEPGGYRLTRPVDSLRVPPTVQATLAARIDRLTEREKAVLQMSAVIGRNFTEPVLRLVSGQSTEELNAVTSRLRAAEFIQEVSFDPVEEYRFWHPLTQEVAYGGLLRERREALHAAVAEAIAATEPDRLDERAALVATHWERAGRPLEGARWNERAALWALRRDTGEALRRWQAMVHQLRSVEDSDEAGQLAVRARIRLIRYGARTGMRTDEIEQLYAEATALAERSGDLVSMALVMNAYGTFNLWRGNVRRGADLYRKAALVADETDDLNARCVGWISAGSLPIWVGPLSDGFRGLDRVVEVSGGDPDVGAELFGYSPLARSLLSRAELFLLSGELDDARREADRAVALTRERSEAETLAWSHSIYPRLARTPAEIDEGLKHAAEAVRIAEDIGNPAVRVTALGAVGVAEIALGRAGDAVSSLETALAQARDLGVALFEEPTLLIHLARALLDAGEGEGAARAADEAVTVARGQGASVVECLALLTRAGVRRALGADPPTVEADLAAALHLARQTGATAYEQEIEAAKKL
jgi:adenylate cyclase